MGKTNELLQFNWSCDAKPWDFGVQCIIFSDKSDYLCCSSWMNAPLQGRYMHFTINTALVLRYSWRNHYPCMILELLGAEFSILHLGPSDLVARKKDGLWPTGFPLGWPRVEGKMIRYSWHGWHHASRHTFSGWMVPFLQTSDWWFGTWLLWLSLKIEKVSNSGFQPKIKAASLKSPCCTSPKTKLLALNQGWKLCFEAGKSRLAALILS